MKAFKLLLCLAFLTAIFAVFDGAQNNAASDSGQGDELRERGKMLRYELDHFDYNNARAEVNVIGVKSFDVTNICNKYITNGELINDVNITIIAAEFPPANKIEDSEIHIGHTVKKPVYLLLGIVVGYVYFSDEIIKLKTNDARTLAEITCEVSLRPSL